MTIVYKNENTTHQVTLHETLTFFRPSFSNTKIVTQKDQSGVEISLKPGDVFSMRFVQVDLAEPYAPPIRTQESDYIM